MRAALADDEWDAVVDTWSAAPVAVQTSSRLLRGRAGHYTLHLVVLGLHVADRVGADESAPVVDGDPALDDGCRLRRRQTRRRARRAHRSSTATSRSPRAGLILGPYEIVGRMPFWLDRIAAGGPRAGPGPVRAAAAVCRLPRHRRMGTQLAPVGTFNTVSEPGHTTIGDLLDEART